MANTYKNIVITPNIGSSNDEPNIVFSGANTTANTDITLYAYPTSNGTLSFEGSAGQLFSITNDLSNLIFSVADVSGIPSFEVYANGLVSLVPVSGNVAVGSSNASYTLDVDGDIRATANIYGTISTTSQPYITANNSSYLGGTSAASYQLNSTLAANVATLTSNNATYAYGKTEGALNANSATYLGGNTASTLRTYSDTVASTAYSNAVSYAGTIAGTAYTNAVSTASTDATNKAANAYSNAVSYASNASNLSTGTVSAAILGSGTANSTTYLAGDNTWQTVSINPAGSNTQIQFNNSGSFGASAGLTFDSSANNLSVANTVSATHFDNVSDVSLKDNILTISNSLDILNNLNPVSFNWKESGEKSFGLIAQEVESILPEIVHSKSDDVKTVSYIQLIPFLIHAIKQQNEEIRLLKEKLQ